MAIEKNITKILEKRRKESKRSVQVTSRQEPTQWKNRDKTETTMFLAAYRDTNDYR